MKKIKDLRVTVTYTVGYGDIEVSDKVFEQLENNSEFTSDDMENSEAIEWLSSNIKEEDAMDWKWEIDDITE
jgi:predicted membrane protein